MPRSGSSLVEHIYHHIISNNTGKILFFIAYNQKQFFKNFELIDTKLINLIKKNIFFKKL